MSIHPSVPDGVTANIEVVTPDQALEHIATTKINRPLSADTIDLYARDMASGRWRFTGEPVKFDRDGHLSDGQHRMHAVFQAETVLPFLIVRGLEPEAQENMDTGRKRTVANSLHLRGSDGKYATNVAALASLVLEKQHPGQNYRPTPSEQLALIDSDPHIRTIAIEIIHPLPKFPGLTKTWAGYCYWRLRQVDDSATAKFFDGLSTLENLGPGSPILALHKRLLNQPKGAGRDTRDQAIALVFTAWNAWRRGDERARIQTPGLRQGVIAIPEPI